MAHCDPHGTYKASEGCPGCRREREARPTVTLLTEDRIREIAREEIARREKATSEHIAQPLPHTTHIFNGSGNFASGGIVRHPDLRALAGEYDVPEPTFVLLARDRQKIPDVVAFLAAAQVEATCESA